MLKSNQSALQVFKDGQWKYVFCLSEHNEIITTKNRSQALGSDAWQYFSERKANDRFRTTKS